MGDEADRPVHQPEAGGLIRFGPFEVDSGQRLLLRDGKRLRLGGRAMDILLTFLAEPGRLLPAEELAAKAWGGRGVENATLRAHILSLRRALGDGAEGAAVIQNVPARGYRFAATVERADAPPMPQHSLLQKPADPQDAQRMVGRSAIVASLCASLKRRRLVSIVGPGGIGKTTVASAARDAFGTACADGTHWVDLGGLARGDSVAEAIAISLGLANFRHDPTPGLLAWLAGKNMLLVLDCCDRVVEDVAAFAERAMHDVPSLHILSTSREVLRASGEHVVRLAPLAAPPEEAALSLEEAASYPAIQLFTERAASVLGGFALTQANLAAVSRICTRLDGIALAIELAASHLVGIDVDRLADLLDNKFRLLAAGRRTALPRHRTMHAALEWSFATLTPHEHNALLCLAVFEGDTELAPIHAVAGDNLSTEQLIEALGKLVDKSLVMTRLAPAGLGYRMLDTTRSFALDRLAESGRLEEVSHRHAKAMIATLHRIEIETQGMYVADWLAPRRREAGNARAALNWAYASPRGEDVRLALSATIVRMLYELSLADQCRRRAAQALDEMARTRRDDPPLEMRLKIYMAFASVYTVGPSDDALAMLERVAAIASETGEANFHATALWGLWSVCIFRGEPEKSLVFAKLFESLEGGPPDAVRRLLVDRMLGTTYHLTGDQEAARARLDRVSKDFDPALHGWNTLGAHINHGLMSRVYLSRVLWMQGFPEQALQLCNECLSTLEREGHAIALCHALFEVAFPINYLNGRMDAVHESVAKLRELAARHGLAIFAASATLAQAALDAAEHGADFAIYWDASRTLRALRYTRQGDLLGGIIITEALRRGDSAAGLAWLDPMLEGCEATGLKTWLPELLRLRGELAASLNDENTRATLDAALANARRHGARLLELRILMSRLRLLEGEDPGELRRLAAHFTEGFGTADLLEARKILEK